MKYAILLADGMSDRPLADLNERTPLEVARTKYMDLLAKNGMIGMAETIPRGMSPGSDVANLSILGYDPKRYYTGRGPLEAANIGVKLGELDVAFRCNLVSVDEDILADYSSGHIIEKEAKIIMGSISDSLGSESVRFYFGKSYRNLMVITAKDKGRMNELATLVCTPPHDIMGKNISGHLPQGKAAAQIVDLMNESRRILEEHEINKVRLDLKENPANMIWLWGQGVNPNLPTYKKMFGLHGAVISAVDLINGIGRLIGLEVVSVPGATGYYDTNYKGKGEYALRCLEKSDFVFVHVEAPDEAGHNGDVRAKIEAIENFDKFIVGPLWRRLKGRDDIRIMALSDHATPISIRTHSDDPVPFVMYGAGIKRAGAAGFNEKNAKASKCSFKSGADLTNYFIHGKHKEKVKTG
ncbi:MAG: cofactor-independent phosphoglycerate mutase [Candidatus Omnitrophota bacterium]